MIWQDVVIAVGQYIFVIALIPSIIGKDKPAISSSILTATVLLIFSFTFFTLHLGNSSLSSLASSISWWILAVQKYRLDRQTGK